MYVYALAAAFNVIHLFVSFTSIQHWGGGIKSFKGQKLIKDSCSAKDGRGKDC